MIFGAVMALGGAAFGIFKLSQRQLSASGEYRSTLTRYGREKRITDMLDDKKDKKDKK